MEKISYKLSAFEGPLDLLLYLISKNKLNIYDIKISSLLEQYMEHINIMKDQEMDIASEFLEMAARLVYIKTVSLLPKHEEEEKLKEELTGQLLEYQDCKKAAGRLSEMICFDWFIRNPAELSFDMTYNKCHEKHELLKAYGVVYQKADRKLPPSTESFSEIVSKNIVSVSSKIVFILRKLWKTPYLNYGSLFNFDSEKSELVATFLAVLELVKGKRIVVYCDKDNCTRLSLLSGGILGWKSKKSKQQ